MILITGATGSIGRDVVAGLTAAGAPVRVFVRDPLKARALPGFDHAELAAGDYGRPETLAPAMDGVERMLLVPPTEPDWGRAQSAIVEAARRAGVRHVVKVSVIGAGPDERPYTLRAHHAGERELEASGMAWTHLRPSSFMQNLATFYAATIAAESAFYQCTGEHPMSLIDTRDVAEVAVLALTERGHEGAVHTLTGPEAITYAEVARRLSAVLGREIRYVDLPPDEYKRAMAGAGLPDWAASEIADLYGRSLIQDGRAAEITATLRELLGRPPRGFDEFARDYAPVFAAR